MSERDAARDLDEAEGRELVALARRTLERRARGEDVFAAAERERPPDGSPLMSPLGVFVTLRKGRSLRGCIGAVEGRRPLYLSVVEEAVNAAENDPRFVPLRPEELPRTHIEITVLGPLRRIPDHHAFQAGRHGILLEKGEFRAVFLPQVATEQGWGPEETLDHLAEKAGLRPGDWREGAILRVFTGQVFQEEEGTGAGGGG
jgi:AmmeMemoRadiSam system protein A